MFLKESGQKEVDSMKFSNSRAIDQWYSVTMYATKSESTTEHPFQFLIRRLHESTLNCTAMKVLYFYASLVVIHSKVPLIVIPRAYSVILLFFNSITISSTFECITIKYGVLHLRNVEKKFCC